MAYEFHKKKGFDSLGRDVIVLYKAICLDTKIEITVPASYVHTRSETKLYEDLKTLLELAKETL